MRARRVQYLLKVQRSNLKYREVQEECKKGWREETKTKRMAKTKKRIHTKTMTKAKTKTRTM